MATDLRGKLEELVATMPHNGARMFSTNKNELGHDACCYLCKLEALLRETAAERAAYGTTECPICGKSEPHSHSQLEEKGYIVALNISNEINRRGQLGLHELARLCGYHLAEYERLSRPAPDDIETLKRDAAFWRDVAEKMGYKAEMSGI